MVEIIVASKAVDVYEDVQLRLGRRPTVGITSQGLGDLAGHFSEIGAFGRFTKESFLDAGGCFAFRCYDLFNNCLLYTSDAADE